MVYEVFLLKVDLAPLIIQEIWARFSREMALKCLQGFFMLSSTYNLTFGYFF